MKRVLFVCIIAAGAALAHANNTAAEPPPVGFEPEMADTVEKASATLRDKKKRSREQVKEEMNLYGGAEVPGLRQWQRRKSPRVAMFSNMVLPGLGQLYNGRRLKTVAMVSLITSYTANIIVEHKRAQRRLKARDMLDPDTFAWREEDLFYQFHRENSKDYMWWTGAVWLIGVLDAFIDAHLFDVREVDPTIFAGSNNQKYVGLSFRL